MPPRTRQAISSRISCPHPLLPARSSGRRRSCSATSTPSPSPREQRLPLHPHPASWLKLWQLLPGLRPLRSSQPHLPSGSHATPGQESWLFRQGLQDPPCPHPSCWVLTLRAPASPSPCPSLSPPGLLPPASCLSLPLCPRHTLPTLHLQPLLHGTISVRPGPSQPLRMADTSQRAPFSRPAPVMLLPGTWTLRTFHPSSSDYKEVSASFLGYDASPSALLRLHPEAHSRWAVHVF